MPHPHHGLAARTRSLSSPEHELDRQASSPRTRVEDRTRPIDREAQAYHEARASRQASRQSSRSPPQGVPYVRILQQMGIHVPSLAPEVTSNSQLMMNLPASYTTHTHAHMLPAPPSSAAYTSRMQPLSMPLPTPPSSSPIDLILASPYGKPPALPSLVPRSAGTRKDVSKQPVAVRANVALDAAILGQRERALARYAHTQRVVGFKAHQEELRAAKMWRAMSSPRGVQDLASL